MCVSVFIYICVCKITYIYIQLFFDKSHTCNIRLIRVARQLSLLLVILYEIINSIGKCKVSYVYSTNGPNHTEKNNVELDSREQYIYYTNVNW